MPIVGIINGDNYNHDYQFSALVRWISSAGIVEWFDIIDNKLSPGICTVECERTNGQKLLVVFESTEEVDLSAYAEGTKIFAEIEQDKINDWSENNEDGTEIWYLRFASLLPSQNFFLIAEIQDGVPVKVGTSPQIKDSALENVETIQEVKSDIEHTNEVINDIKINWLPTSMLTGEYILSTDLVYGSNIWEVKYIDDFTFDTMIDFGSTEGNRLYEFDVYLKEGFFDTMQFWIGRVESPYYNIDFSLKKDWIVIAEGSIPETSVWTERAIINFWSLKNIEKWLYRLSLYATAVNATHFYRIRISKNVEKKTFPAFSEGDWYVFTGFDLRGKMNGQWHPEIRNETGTIELPTPIFIDKVRLNLPYTYAWVWYVALSLDGVEWVELGGQVNGNGNMRCYFPYMLTKFIRVRGSGNSWSRPVQFHFYENNRSLLETNKEISSNFVVKAKRGALGKLVAPLGNYIKWEIRRFSMLGSVLIDLGKRRGLNDDGDIVQSESPYIGDRDYFYWAFSIPSGIRNNVYAVSRGYNQNSWEKFEIKESGMYYITTSIESWSGKSWSVTLRKTDENWPIYLERSVNNSTRSGIGDWYFFLEAGTYYAHYVSNANTYTVALTITGQ